MKFISCLCFISLFSCLICSSNSSLKCGSPTCQDVKVSEAKLILTYTSEHEPVIKVQKGDSVDVYGRGEKKWYIKKGNQYGLIPSTFLKEGKVSVLQTDLVDVSEENILNLHKKSNVLSPTPPLINNSVGDSVTESTISAEIPDEISHSQPFEVIDGTTILFDPNPASDSESESLAENPKVPSIEENEVTTSQPSEPSGTPLGSEGSDNETDSLGSELDKAPPTPGGESELEKTSSMTASTEAESVEDEEQTEGAEDEDGDGDEDETEDEDEPGFISKLVDNALNSFTKESTETESAASAEDTPEPEKEVEASEIDNVVPSTADAIAAAGIETQFYGPSPTILPSKTIESTLEATAQAALSENADSHNSVESAVSLPQDQPELADQVFLDPSLAESANLEISLTNDSSSADVPSKDETELVGSGSLVTPVPKAEDGLVKANISVDSTDTPSMSSESNEVRAFSNESEAASGDKNAIPDENAQIDTNPIPAGLQDTFTEPLALNETDTISDNVPEQPAVVELDTKESSETIENVISTEPPLTNDVPTKLVEKVEIGVKPTESPETYEYGLNFSESSTETSSGMVTPADEGQTVIPPMEEQTTVPPPEKFTDNVSTDVLPSKISMKPELLDKPLDSTGPANVTAEQTMNITSEGIDASTISESSDVNKTEQQPEMSSIDIYDSLMYRNQEAGKVNEVGDPLSTTSDNVSRPESSTVSEKEQTAMPVEAVESKNEVEEAPTAEPEAKALEPEDVKDFWADLRTFGGLGKAIEMGYDSLSSIKESSMFGYLVKKDEDNMQSALKEGPIKSSNYHFDESCRLEDRSCPSVKAEEKLPSEEEEKSPQPKMDSVEVDSDVGILNLVLDPILNSTCMKAQSLLVLLTTAITLIFVACCFFYFDKRSKDASFYKRIDILEKQLFITKKEALEYEIKCSSLSSTVGSPDIDPSLLSLNAAQITELETQRNELSEKVELLANELSITISTNKDLEKRLKEVLSSTQNTEMIFKTVDQLQQRIEMQQKASLELNAQLKNKDQVIEELEESLQKSVAYGNQLEELIASLKKEIEKLSIESSEKIIHLNSELDQVKSEKTLEITKLKGEIDSLKLSLEQARSSLDIAEANIVELKTIISDDAKSSENLGDVFNGSELKAKLAVAELNVDKLKDRLQEESGARQFLEDHVASITEALNQLKSSYSELEKEKQEAENAVKVLKDYFRKQEEELKKEIEEKSAFQLQKDEETLFMKMKQLEDEKSSLKDQIEVMKKEILEQEDTFKREKYQLDQKVNENWLLSRQINRKLQDSKQEAAVLRSRLTAVEKMLAEKNEQDSNENDQSMANGEGTQPAPNVSSPSMLLNFPNTANSSFAKYNSSDLILPPPLALGLPGNEFIPPPPIYHPDLRLPPLGSVGRMPSPPRGMSPPLSLETNYGLNFSPPPPMPPQYYYYHRSDSPSDYDSSSYSKGDKYRGDSPERSGSSKNKMEDPSRKPPSAADHQDSYPSSNPSHLPPLKPVARNPIVSGSKGWSTSGQSSKSVEKNSRNSGR